VLDEVDQLLDMGFRDDITYITKHSNNCRQTIGFSATIGKNIKKLSYAIMENPEFISAKSSEIPDHQIDQNVIFTKPREKFDDLQHFLNEANPFLAIIFCRTRKRVDTLDLKLAQAGFNCAKLHGGMPQSKRQKSMKAFKALKIQYLICTEVAARGIDVTGVTHVINYDMPETHESYIHRVGRTGRVNATGKTYLFVNEDEKETFESLKTELNLNIKPSDH
jgi:ATP-dependent RNA helicase DeaD